MKRILKYSTFILLLLAVSSILLFTYNSMKRYRISSSFESVPLKYDAYTNTSSYVTGGFSISVEEGYVKGMLSEKSGTAVIVRALSPLLVIDVESSHDQKIIVENISPETYAMNLKSTGISFTKVSDNSIEFTVSKGNTRLQQDTQTSAERNKFVILGDNRDGYEMFENIITQVNALKPAFVIDNGDLVFSGKANQYRLFDNIARKVAGTFLTTLGNHDIRGDGSNTYSVLYGPSFYSLDYGDMHFAFLDSSPGWVEFTSISDEQYKWLEQDLEKAHGKKLFVITHIPPTDPRDSKDSNLIPNYYDKVSSGNNKFTSFLNEYSKSKSMDHGFQDQAEAQRFESIMSRYGVDTVFVSHIHDYIEYYRQGVRYVITGGAGAELLTANSSYHYLVYDMNDTSKVDVIQMKSPANNLLQRYYATARLFANALYMENRTTVTLVLAFLLLLAINILLLIYVTFKRQIDAFREKAARILKYAVKEFRGK